MSDDREDTATPQNGGTDHITCWNCRERVNPIEVDDCPICPECDAIVVGQTRTPYRFYLDGRDPEPIGGDSAR